MMLITPGHLSWNQLREIRQGDQRLDLTEAAWASVQASAQAVAEVLTSGQVIYGLNTGFGKLASTRIPDSDHAQLQLNLLRSHAVGVGEPMTDAVVRLMLLLKAASLGRGHSGVSPALVRGLLDLLAHDLITGDRNTEIEDGFVALGFAASGLRHGLRSDDLNAQWAAVQAGLGVGFMTEHLIGSDPTVTAILPMIELPVLPIWLTVHRELRTSALMRAVFDFLAEEVPLALAGPAKP
jgi:DNA-binding transcriptional LysR family regulator